MKLYDEIAKELNCDRSLVKTAALAVFYTFDNVNKSPEEIC